MTMETSNLSGPWKAEMYEEHLPEHYAFDEGLIRSMLEFYKPQKSLDLGCGLGYFVKYLRDQGVDAWGVEPEHLGDHFKSPGHHIPKDLSKSFDLEETYDLVMCLEVVEHIPRDFENIVFDNIVRHMSRYLLFSGATVGQYGTGHINERPEHHWFAHLVRRGLVLKHEPSILLRQACTLPWYANNVSIWELVHPNSTTEADAIAERDSQILRAQRLINNLNLHVHELQSQQALQLQQAQLELEQSRYQLQQAQSELRSTQTSLSQKQSELEQSRSDLQKSELELKQKQSHLHQIQFDLEQSQLNMQQIQFQLNQLQAEISAIQISPFWKLREVQFKIRRALGLLNG